MRGFCLSSSFPEKGVGWLEIPKPQIQNPYDAILEPVAVSPCTSDVHSARANMAGGNAASNLILGKTGQKRPDIVLGHEAVGRVVEVGALVTDFKVGDVVSVPCVTPNWLTLEVQTAGISTPAVRLADASPPCATTAYSESTSASPSRT